MEVNRERIVYDAATLIGAFVHKMWKKNNLAWWFVASDAFKEEIASLMSYWDKDAFPQTITERIRWLVDFYATAKTVESLLDLIDEIMTRETYHECLSQGEIDPYKVDFEGKERIDIAKRSLAGNLNKLKREIIEKLETLYKNSRKEE